MKRTISAMSALVFLLLWLFSFSAAAEQAYDCGSGQHKYVVVSHTPATEQADGLDVYRCELCGQEYEAVLPATSHVWSNWVTDKAPTCTEPGRKHRTCSAHSPHDETENIPALGHEYKLTETPPGCDTDGVMTYTCSRCGDSYTKPGKKALGHDYKGKITREATCTEDGIKTFVCSHDKKHTYTEPVPATGHDYGKWTEEIPAGEGKAGLKVSVCKNCNERKQREIPALPVAPTAPPEQPKPLFNTLDAVLLSFDAFLIALGAVTLYPSFAAVRRVKKLWKQYLASKKCR